MPKASKNPQIYQFVGLWVTHKQANRINENRRLNKLSTFERTIRADEGTYPTVTDEVANTLKTASYARDATKPQRVSKHPKSYTPGQYYLSTTRTSNDGVPTDQQPPADTRPLIRDLTIQGHRGKLLAWPTGALTNAPYAASDPADYDAEPRRNVLQYDEEYAEMMTKFEDASKAPDHFVFIDARNPPRNDFIITQEIRALLAKGKFVVLFGLDPQPGVLEPEWLRQNLMLDTALVRDVTDAMLRVNDAGEAFPWVRMSLDQLCERAKDPKSTPLACLEIALPELQNRFQKHLSDGHHDILNPPPDTPMPWVLNGISRVTGYMVGNAGTHVTWFHYDSPGFGSCFQMHGTGRKFWGFACLDFTNNKDLGGLMNTYSEILSGKISVETPVRDRKGVRFFVLEVTAGCMVFANPGTIHSVYTPSASLMTGGNFVFLFGMHIVEYARLRERSASHDTNELDGAEQMEDAVYVQDIIVQSMACLHRRDEDIGVKPLISLCRMVAYPKDYLPAVLKSAKGPEATRLRQYHRGPSSISDKAACARAKHILSHLSYQGWNTLREHLVEGEGLMDTLKSIPIQSLQL
ncbi:hypothetical protein BD626DRAFT_575767 [Schizophyllum amplum]|uniref:JmjC domain-containing protein n=1 Tax=Schizophyllum amplum TaxID=97359 RepID=A0A550BUZ9_9AGAR|nr:hypothetical protein BD626DRAFT_575767 [Auriculariopsis ampla]